jgi:hypothetical protein
MGTKDRLHNRRPLWGVLVAAELFDYADWYCAGWYERAFVVRLVTRAYKQHGAEAVMAAVHRIVPGAKVHGDVKPYHFRRIVDAMLALNHRNRS